MAAVLCNACAEVASGVGNVMGQVCRLPAQLCQAGCGACSTLCDATLSGLFQSPFGLLVVVALVFNGPPVYVGFLGVLEEGVACQGARWLLVQALLCLANMAAALYMGITVVQQVNLEETNMVAGQQIPQTVFARAGHLLCYDPVLAVYILVVLGFIVWLWTGAAWALSDRIHDGCTAADSVVARRVAVALGFGWAFLFFGVTALCLGMCCAYLWDSNTDATTGSSSIPYGSETPYVNASHNDTSKPMTTASVYDSTKPLSVPTVAATTSTTTPTKSEPPTAQAVLF